MPTTIKKVIILYILFINLFNKCIPSPPTILIQPDKQIIFDPFKNIELPCDAMGVPEPKYTWTKDKLIYDPSSQNNRVTIKNNSGTLIITNPTAADQGWYQCNATNKFGTALSDKSHLRMAQLLQFPNSTTTKIVRARRGDSIVLNCTPPTSVPDPYVYWSVVGDNDHDPFVTIAVSDRVTQDYYGNLYILNVEDEDEKDGRPYACNAYNRRLLRISQGELTILEVEKVSPTRRFPDILWKYEKNKTFLLGDEMRLKCIFGGMPTPKVIWRKIDGQLPTDGRFSTDSVGQELVIRNVNFEDQGTYVCGAGNELGINEESINIDVESKPYWRYPSPYSIKASPNKTVTFECNADGVPSPNKVDWYVNGHPIQKEFLEANKRILINNKELTIKNVQPSDTSVFSCNVSNKHGYLWENVFLDVFAVPPEFQVPMDNEILVVEGELVAIGCSVFSRLRVQIVWRRNLQLVSGGRFVIRPDGSLYLSSATVADSGTYECTATNRYGSVKGKSQLIVQPKTILEIISENKKIRVGSSLTFRCLTKSAFDLNYTVFWFKDSYPISHAGRFIQDPLNQTILKINDLKFEDIGSYSCAVCKDAYCDDILGHATISLRLIDSATCTDHAISENVNATQYSTSTPSLNEWTNVTTETQRAKNSSTQKNSDVVTSVNKIETLVSIEPVTLSPKQSAIISLKDLQTYKYSFNLTWSIEDKMNVTNLFYVKFRKADDPTALWLRTALSTANSTAIGGLDSCTKYEVIIVATSDNCNSLLETESELFILKTGQPRSCNNFLYQFIQEYVDSSINAV